MSSAIGPYKGGLRFHPSVNLGILKFCLRAGVEEFPDDAANGRQQGRLRLDPKGKSDNEVMRFCQSFMTELCRISAQTRTFRRATWSWRREIGFLFGQYKR